MKKSHELFCCFVSIIFMAGCATSPASDAGFIDGSKTVTRKDLPFQNDFTVGQVISGGFFHPA